MRPIETYRGFIIEGAGHPGWYRWLNEDIYDGPESDCIGEERTLTRCRSAIDEYIDEQDAPKLERCAMCPTLTDLTDSDHNAQCSRHGGR